MTDRDRLWTARLRAAAAHWRQCYAAARESLRLAIGQIEQISADRDMQAARAEAAERRERELREALQMHRNAMQAALHPMMDGSERLRIKELLAKPAIATSAAEPRAGQPPQTEGV